MSKVLCICGMCGSGKTEVMNIIRAKKDFGYVRFGQTVLDIVKTLTNKPTEEIERKVRNDLRQKHGMAAMAIVNIPKIDELLKKGDVIVDGLYSWEEYLELRNKYPDNLTVIAVYAPPKIRYERLVGRAEKYKDDSNLVYRSYTAEQAWSRDKSEIEEIHKAGPIAMADYTIQNTGTIKDLTVQIEDIYSDIFS